MMDYLGVVKSIERGLISPVYLLYGEESYLIENLIKGFKGLLVNQDTGDFNLDIIDGKTVGLNELVNLANTLPFMADKRLVIVHQADFFKAKKKGGDDEDNTGEKALLTYLENPPDTTCLIMSLSEGVDKRKKIFKLVDKNGQVVDCSPLKGQALEEWISGRVKHHGVKIEKTALGKLIASVGSNLNLLDNEIAKMSNYVVSTRTITLEIVDLMVSRTVENSIFDLVDAIGEKRIERALPIIKELLFQGEPAIRILFMITRQIRLIIQGKVLLEQGYAEKQIAGNLQVHPYVIQKCCKQGKNFTIEELEKALIHLLDVDYSLKTGRLEQNYALETLLVDLCN